MAAKSSLVWLGLVYFTSTGRGQADEQDRPRYHPFHQHRKQNRFGFHQQAYQDGPRAAAKWTKVYFL
jgi:hypothetical protein